MSPSDFVPSAFILRLLVTSHFMTGRATLVDFFVPSGNSQDFHSADPRHGLWAMRGVEALVLGTKLRLQRQTYKRWVPTLFSSHK